MPFLFVGPDVQSVKKWRFRDMDFELHGFVLHMRGTSPMPQPIQDESGNLLCFNGEIFGGLQVSKHENDAMVLMNALRKDSVLPVFSNLQGPWAFVYWHNQSKRLYYGRDFLGRRSLLMKQSLEHFILSSTSYDGHEDWKEVEAHGRIYCVDYSLKQTSELSLLTTIPRINVAVYEWPSENVNHSCLFDKMDSCMEFKDAAQTFLKELTSSVSSRVESIHSLPHHQPRLGILFSGGIDCTILAALSHALIPLQEPIDLLNVAFENPRSTTFNRSIESFHVPDRLTGQKSLAELKRLFPKRKWNFVEINVTTQEYMEAKNHVLKLMNPANTVMDLSIAIAIWFASRGIGELLGIDYTSPSRVLLSGLGADEQLGGYSRHQKSFSYGGWPALVQELQLDLDRISLRNLGRDDRIVSDHGKEIRFPFLDESLIRFLVSLPVNFKVDPNYEKGLGDKYILRWVLHKLLHFSNIHLEPKRAIQFGSKTAKMETNDKGHVQVQSLFKSEYSTLNQLL